MSSSLQARRGAAAAVALASGAALYAAPAVATSPSYAVVCSSATIEAPRSTTTTFTLSCTTTDGGPIDEYVAVTRPVKAALFELDGPTGQVTYRPSDSAVGTDIFTFRGVVDGLGHSETTRAVVTLQNQRPTCQPVAPVSVVHDRSAVVAVSCQDPDGDVLEITTGTLGAGHGSVSAGTDAGATYTPAAGYTGPDAFTLVATDGNLRSEEVTVAVEVTNARPVCTSRDVTVSHDRASRLGLRCDDADGDALVRRVVSGAQHGTVKVKDDDLVYRPAAGFLGEDTFTVGAHDGVRDSRPVRYHVEVVNSAPRCSGDTEFRTRGPREVDFSCSERDGDDLRVKVEVKPDHGTLERRGATVTYVPDRRYRGRDSFSLSATDGIAHSKPVEYSVKVLRRSR